MWYTPGIGGIMSYFTPPQIASILAVSPTNVYANYPAIETAMNAQGLNERPDMIAALATIGTEVPSFQPISEYGSGAEYEGRTDLGNTSPGDGVRYKGRGLIQVTGKANYQYFGNLLGYNLMDNPDLALDPLVAANVLAAYMKIRGVSAAARAGNWENSRILVNGGTNGLQRYLFLVEAFLDLAPPLIQEHSGYKQLKVLRDTYLRAQPVLTAFSLPLDLLRVGTRIERLDGFTPHWLEVQVLSDTRKGWVYKENLGPIS